ncbi:alpha-L-glutamate ligase [Lysinibacillus sp. 2017]|uniref:ATP-grasp domain-containing protein n=1 Tax=unclassified Lysinibacillus TaxID=2636778 RepID=UPI000D527AD2|nr:MULTISPECIES: alpha-L-glutamate ligase [unclassified Lysinibacillus]AWE07119.1 alpha-L-glutamate ligase [Lysinibacillus sp. 2017]TGN36962.1 alpha-L-glutamate ligase [Lysinibacillus sp. S2017]
MTKKIYVIHENNEWTIHLQKRLEQLNLPYELWHLDEGTVNLLEAPPDGVFYSRMSASSHTRNHRYAPELTGAVLEWLEFHGRKVFNGSEALRYELSKVKQYTQLERFGIQTPRTVVAVGKVQIIEAAKQLNLLPFITKHNRAGKGLGVQLFYSIEALEEYVYSDRFEEPVDGITLVQQYIKSPEQFITRAEFIGGKYMYSVRVDTSEGFELCPADACQIGDLYCPVGEQPKSYMKFEIIDNPYKELIEKFEIFLAGSSIAVAGIEFIVDEEGNTYAYDVNTNTNYNADAENAYGTFAMLELAKFLGEQLADLA